jgi:hypothetical protein
MYFYNCTDMLYENKVFIKILIILFKITKKLMEENLSKRIVTDE